MSRPRKPTAILELTGAYKKDPARAASRTGEPLPDSDIGDPPTYFNEFLLEIWHELLDEAAPGVIKKSDKKALEAWVQIIAFIRIGAATPPLFAMHKAYAQQFGMTPAARSMVNVPQDDNGNEFARAAADLAKARAVAASSG